MRSKLTPAVCVSTDAKNLVVIMYLLTLIFSFIPALLAYCFKKDDEFVYYSAKEALNWSLTVLIISVVVTWIPILGWIVAGVLYVMNVICCILAALNASKGLRYRFPFAFHLIA